EHAPAVEMRLQGMRPFTPETRGGLRVGRGRQRLGLLAGLARIFSMFAKAHARPVGRVGDDEPRACGWSDVTYVAYLELDHPCAEPRTLRVAMCRSDGFGAAVAADQGDVEA